MSWHIGMVCNAIIALAYFLIVVAIVVPLARSHQLRSNPLGAATGAIFLTCAVHHGAHSVHMLLPSLGVDDPQGLAMRAAWDWPLAIWDVIGAVVGLYYWTLRTNYSSLMQGAQLFEDLRRREQQALELNDSVLQGLVVAKMALDLDPPEKAHEALTSSIPPSPTGRGPAAPAAVPPVPVPTAGPATPPREAPAAPHERPAP